MGSHGTPHQSFGPNAQTPQQHRPAQQPPMSVMAGVQYPTNQQQQVYRYPTPGSNPPTAHRMQSLPDIDRLRQQSVPPNVVMVQNNGQNGGVAQSHSHVNPGGAPMGARQMQHLHPQQRPQFNPQQQQFSQPAQQHAMNQRFPQRPSTPQIAQQQMSQMSQQQMTQQQISQQMQMSQQQINAQKMSATQMAQQHHAQIQLQQMGRQQQQPPPQQQQLRRDNDNMKKPNDAPQDQQRSSVHYHHQQQPRQLIQPGMSQVQVSPPQSQPSMSQIASVHRPITDSQSSIRTQSQNASTPRSTTPGVLTPGSISPGATIMNRAGSPPPSLQSITSQRQQVVNPNDSRQYINTQQLQHQQQVQLQQQQLRGMVPLRPSMPTQMVHQPGSRPTDTYAVLDPAQRQQQIPPGTIGAFHFAQSQRGSYPDRVPYGPGMYLSLGAALRAEGAFESREFAYTECLLRGLAAGDRLPQIGNQLVEILTGLTGMKPQIGLWKTECWKAVLDREQLAASSGNLINTQSGFDGELWLKRYAEPAALKDFYCLRMFSPEHLVVPSNFPCNARRVNEAAVSPQFIKLLPRLGFETTRNKQFYCSCYLFHHNVGTPESQLMILIQKHFKDEAMTEDMFPNQMVVEVIGRVEEDNMIDPLSRRILDFCRNLQP